LYANVWVSFTAECFNMPKYLLLQPVSNQ